ncbi:MAG: hypothetical protein NWE79_01605 [Candidatus Bathyarchaeota archaeon]|nr:hypothetical protein [Candidatus Bathyarchaeota archaeon]
MAPLSTVDIGVGLAAIAVAALAIYLFIRASSGSTEEERKRASILFDEEEHTRTPLSISAIESSDFRIPKAERYLRQPDVSRARSSIRTLTLQREILGMVLKRLFEAEDEGEITREERIRLSKGYETELKQLSEELKQVELIMTLHELETIRDDILQKFEETLSSTQTKIDGILRELKIEERREPPRRIRPAPREEVLPEEEEVEEEEEPAAPRRPRSDVEEKLEQLRMEVLKELEELEKLELEA